MDELLDIVAKSISGTTLATKVSAQMVEAGLYSTLLDEGTEAAERVGIFRRLYPAKTTILLSKVTALPIEVTTLPIGVLRESLSNLYTSIQGALGSRKRALNASRTSLGEVKYAEEEVALIKIEREEVAPLKKVIEQLNEMQTQKKDGDEDILLAIELARPYLMQKQRKLFEGVEKSVEALVNPPPTGGHSASKLFRNLDKLIADLRESRGALYAACSGDGDPFIVVERVFNAASPEGEMHAEMKVLRYFVERFMRGGGEEADLPEYLKRVLPYIGISKLGCFDCALVLEVLDADSRGRHGTKSTEWVSPGFLDSLPLLAARLRDLRLTRTPTKDKTTVMYPDPSPSPIKAGGDVASVSPTRVKKEFLKRVLYRGGSPSVGGGGGPGSP